MAYSKDVLNYKCKSLSNCGTKKNCCRLFLGAVRACVCVCVRARVCVRACVRVWCLLGGVVKLSTWGKYTRRSHGALSAREGTISRVLSNTWDTIHGI